jgi:hypothetical protein
LDHLSFFIYCNFSGIRAGHRKLGLSVQYKAPGQLQSKTYFDEICQKLLNCRSNDIDTLVAPTLAAPARVKFKWMGYARNSIAIVGEFTGKLSTIMSLLFVYIIRLLPCSHLYMGVSI